MQEIMMVEYILKPEDQARQNIDKMLADSGWKVQHYKKMNRTAGLGVAVAYFPLANGLQADKEVIYQPALPIETFDFIITDECHRSIYNLWRQVLEYFDAFIIGLTAMPSKQTLGFFNQNLVMEYSHEQAVADGVNVGYEVYRIKTKITEEGSRVEAGNWVDKRDRLTRKLRWEQLDEDL